MIVVDASLAVKWYVFEPLSEQAIGFYAENQGKLCAPDIFVIEVIATLVRRANVEKSLRSDSEKAIANFTKLLDSNLVEARRTTTEQMARAASIAIDLGHPLKDCIYLALAMELGCDFITCDARFVEKAKGVWDRVRVLES